MNVVVSILIFLGAVVALAYPLGVYMAKVFSGERTFMTRLLLPIERLIYRLFGVNENDEMDWKTYLKSFSLLFGVGVLFLFALQIFQHHLPLNPTNLGPVRWDTALNTSISFNTNTNWQAYAGEQTMSYLTQMLGLTVQNFISAAAGLAAGIVLVRGFARKNTGKLGNFWVDMVRGTLYVLLPLVIVVTIVLVSQGVVQTFAGSATVTTLEGKTQTIALGPAASQIAIKQLGSNGGGFFNANSAHPFENPTPPSNFLELLSILLIPVALCFTFGKMQGDMKKGWALFSAMAILFAIGLSVAVTSEASLYSQGPYQSAGISTGVFEGKEVRFGETMPVLWGQATTATSNGSVNGMHESFAPTTSFVYMFNMAVGEVVFGGIGVGLIGMIMYAILAMFIAGLMIGRTPELMGKKLEIKEMIWASVSILAPAIVLLILTAFGLGNTPASVSHQHTFSQVFYANCSYMGNNGSAFAGLNSNTVFFNLSGSFGMLFGRFATIVPGIAIAGLLSSKKTSPQNVAQINVASPLFVLLLVGVVIIVGALTFFPALTLGPLLEHLGFRAM